MGGRIVTVLALLMTAGGIALIVGGSPVIGAIVLVLGLFVSAVAAAVSYARGLLRRGREIVDLVSGGKPSAVRIIKVEPPRTVIRSPSMSVEVELTQESGHRHVTQEVDVPRLYALGFLLARRLPFNFAALNPERLRLDLEERRVELAQAGPEPAGAR
jgi:hypothetical protein